MLILLLKITSIYLAIMRITATLMWSCTIYVKKNSKIKLKIYEDIIIQHKITIVLQLQNVISTKNYALFLDNFHKAR